MAHFGVQKAKKMLLTAGIACVAGSSVASLDASAASYYAANTPDNVVPKLIEVSAGGSTSEGVTTGSGHKSWGASWSDNGNANVLDNMAFPLANSFKTMTISVTPKDGQTVQVIDPTGTEMSLKSTSSNGAKIYKIEDKQFNMDGDYKIIIKNGTDSKTYTAHMYQAREMGNSHDNDSVYFNFQNANGDLWQEEFIYVPNKTYTVKRPHGYNLVQVESIKGCDGHLRSCGAASEAPSTSNQGDNWYSVALGTSLPSAYIGLPVTSNTSSSSEITRIGNNNTMFVDYVHEKDLGNTSAVDTKMRLNFGEYPYTLVDFTNGNETEQKQIDFIGDDNEEDYNPSDLDIVPEKATCAKGTGSVDLEEGKVNKLTCVDSDGTHIVNIDMTRFVDLKEGESKKLDNVPEGAENGEWSTDSDVCTINADGTVKGNKAGVCHVTLKFDDGSFYTWTIVVSGATNPDTFDKGTVSAFTAAGAAIGGLTAVFATVRRFFGRK